jgi:hypothetical protein
MSRLLLSLLVLASAAAMGGAFLTCPRVASAPIAGGCKSLVTTQATLVGSPAGQGTEGSDMKVRGVTLMYTSRGTPGRNRGCHLSSWSL